jgi:hypothetical protein
VKGLRSPSRASVISGCWGMHRPVRCADHLRHASVLPIGKIGRAPCHFGHSRAGCGGLPLVGLSEHHDRHRSPSCRAAQDECGEAVDESAPSCLSCQCLLTLAETDLPQLWRQSLS